METGELDFSSEFSQPITSYLHYVKRLSLLVCVSCASTSHVRDLTYCMQILYSFPRKQIYKVRYRFMKEYIVTGRSPGSSAVLIKGIFSLCAEFAID